jgi:hypothetical protein
MLTRLRLRTGHQGSSDIASRRLWTHSITETPSRYVPASPVMLKAYISFSSQSPRLARFTDVELEASNKTRRSPRNKPSRTLRRALSSRVSKNKSPRQRAEVTMANQLPDTPVTALSSVRVRYHNGLQTSESLPLVVVRPSLRKNGPDLPESVPTSNSFTTTIDVTDKINAMLAATDALKPSASQLGTSPGFKRARMTSSRVLSKVSSAWDKLHLKRPAQDSTPNHQRPFVDNGNGWLSPLPLPRPTTPNNFSSIRTIEIRLNEGDNLNRRKVQRIVGGGQVARKPVADGGESLRSGRSMDDQFSDMCLCRTPTGLEVLGSPTTLGSETQSFSSHSSENPFRSEAGFDRDLHYGVLRATPEGRSTPRLRIDSASLAILEGSPRRKRCAIRVDRLEYRGHHLRTHSYTE